MVMQQMSSHLKKNLGDDNESGASQFVVIFCIFLGVADDDEPPWLVVIFLFFFPLSVVDDGSVHCHLFVFFLRCSR